MRKFPSPHAAIVRCEAKELAALDTERAKVPLLIITNRKTNRTQLAFLNRCAQRLFVFSGRGPRSGRDGSFCHISENGNLCTYNYFRTFFCIQTIGNWIFFVCVPEIRAFSLTDRKILLFVDCRRKDK